MQWKFLNPLIFNRMNLEEFEKSDLPAQIANIIEVVAKEKGYEARQIVIGIELTENEKELSLDFYDFWDFKTLHTTIFTPKKQINHP